MNPIRYVVTAGEKVHIADLAPPYPHTPPITVVVPAGMQAELSDDGVIAIADITLIVEQDASVVYRGNFLIDDRLIQRAVTMQCDAAGSSAALEVSCQTKGSGSFTLATHQNHYASHSQSLAKILGVSSDISRATVTSNICINKGLRDVGATQVHKHLLLDVGARVVSVPALDILSNDVTCSHGSAITHLDATQLFYLTARGYGVEEARAAMVKAFLAS